MPCDITLNIFERYHEKVTVDNEHSCDSSYKIIIETQTKVKLFIYFVLLRNCSMVK
jgi:hypothetical protein